VPIVPIIAILSPMAKERIFEDLPALVSPIFEFSFTESVTQSNREKSKRRRNFAVEFSARTQSPPVQLAPNAGLLYLHLNDVVVAAAAALLEAKDSLTLDELLDAIGRRQFYDPTIQAYATPSSMTTGQLEFLIRRDPAVSELLEVDAQIIRGRLRA
jgi:hypothetical protein